MAHKVISIGISKDSPTLEEIIKERITSLTKSEQTYKDIDKVLVSICKENRIILESILTEYNGGETNS